MRFLLKHLGHLFLKYAPSAWLLDRLYAWALFVWSLKRFPSNRLLINDVIYRIKVSRQIEHPLRVFVSDKEYVKFFITSIVGREYVVPTLGVIRNKNELFEFSFPEGCAIKATHGSGQICFSKSGIDVGKLSHWFSINYYRASRERNYRLLEPKLIVEPDLSGGGELVEYKVFCWNGYPGLIQYGLHKGGGATDFRQYFDRSWRLISRLESEQSPAPVQPKFLDEMLDVAEKLSEHFDLIRVDFLAVGSKFYVGELTNCHWSGNDFNWGLNFEHKISGVLFSDFKELHI